MTGLLRRGTVYPVSICGFYGGAGLVPVPALWEGRKICGTHAGRGNLAAVCANLVVLLFGECGRLQPWEVFCAVSGRILCVGERNCAGQAGTEHLVDGGFVRSWKCGFRGVVLSLFLLWGFLG